MLNKLLTFLLVIVLIGSNVSTTMAMEINQPHVNQGYLDLSSWGLAENGILPLNGQWEFYWKELYTPSTLQTNEMKDSKLYIQVPQVWEGQSDLTLSNQGYGTYRLVVRLNPNDLEKSLVLDIPGVASSYKLWINGQLLKSHGIVGTNKKDMVPQSYPEPIFFTSNQPEVEILLQVSNYVQRKGGLWDAIKLGRAEQIVFEREKNISVQLFIAGGLLVMGLFFMGLYFFKRKYRSTLYFGIACIFMLFRTLFVGDMLWLRFFPSFSWEWSVKIEYVSAYLAAAFFVLYAHQLYINDANKKITYGLFFFICVICVPILFLPAKVYTQWMLFYQSVVLVGLIYIVLVVFLAAKRKRQGAMVNLLFFVILLITAINDVFFYNFIITSVDLAPFGLYLVIFAQSFVLASRFSNVFYQVEKLSVELSQTNQSLEQKVTERTAALLKTNAELRKAETSRKHLLSNISHDIGTPLTSILGYAIAIKQGVLSGNDPKSIDIIYRKAMILKRLTDDLKNMVKLESDNLSFALEKIKLSQFYNSISEKYEIEVKEKGLTFIKEELSWDADQIELMVDVDRMEQVIMNLISNAVKHTDSGGKITVSIRYFSSFKKIVLFVEDTGLGINEEELPYVFDRFYKGERSTTHDSGLGLAISKEIIERHKGRIGVRSEEGKGSLFYLILPVQ